MKRNIILSLILGTLAAYNPFWTWSGITRAAGILALGVVSFVGLLKTDGGERKWKKIKLRKS